VTIGEAALAVGRPAGWEPVRGGLAEVRVHERGTSPPARTGRARAIPGESPIEFLRKEPNRP
jgi:hypothetical protein